MNMHGSLKEDKKDFSLLGNFSLSLRSAAQLAFEGKKEPRQDKASGASRKYLTITTITFGNKLYFGTAQGRPAITENEVQNALCNFMVCFYYYLQSFSRFRLLS